MGVMEKVRKAPATAVELPLDRIIMGEVRGGEAAGMLRAYNTGHPGGVDADAGGKRGLRAGRVAHGGLQSFDALRRFAGKIGQKAERKQEPTEMAGGVGALQWTAPGAHPRPSL